MLIYKINLSYLYNIFEEIKKIVLKKSEQILGCFFKAKVTLQRFSSPLPDPAPLKKSNWPSYHMISLRPLICQPSFPTLQRKKGKKCPFGAVASIAPVEIFGVSRMRDFKNHKYQLNIYV